MTTFDKREEGFEKKFALDEDLKFKAVARRNKLLGQLIAEKLGKSGDEAAAYAKEVVAAVFEGDGDVLRKVIADVKAKGVDMAVHLTRIYTKTGDDGTTALGDMTFFVSVAR